MNECNKCKLCVERTKVVPARGNLNSPICLLGMGPGATEDQKGIPFCGDTGALLHRLLADAGLSNKTYTQNTITGDNEWLFEVYAKKRFFKVIYKPYIMIDNVVRCRPPNNRAPTLEEMEACHVHTERLFRRMPNLKVIIACGAPVLQHFTGHTSITKYRGYPFQYNDYIVIPIVHPRFIQQQWQYYDITVYDLEKANRLALEGWQPPKTDYVEASHIPRDEVLGKLSKCYAFDIETVGMEEKDALDPVRGHITGMACSYAEGKAIHFDFDNRYERDLAKEVLENDAYKTAHNATFDVTFLRRMNIKIKADFDTSLAQYSLVPHWPKSLAFCNSLHTDYPYYKSMRTSLDRNDRITYCCFDADTTYQNYVKLSKEVKQEGTSDVLKEIVFPLVHVCSGMTLTGIKVNEQMLDEQLEEVSKEADQIWDHFDKYNVNIRSPKQLNEMFVALGLGRQASTDEDHLERLYKNTESPVVAAILDYRKKNTIQKWLRTIKSNLFNGRIHARFGPSGTETGRLNSEKPNMQNVNKKRRHIFIPDEGKVLLQADYDRLEFAVAAILANDEKMIHDAFYKHIHKEVTTLLHGPNYTDQQYLEGKSIVFGLIYGRTTGSIALKFGIPKWKAQKYVDIVLGNYPGLDTFRKTLQRKAKSDGFLRSAFGRIRYFLRGNITGQALNFPVQSAAADVTLSSLIRLSHLLEEKYPEADLLLSVHDSILIQCPEEDVYKYAKLMKEVMERPIPQLKNMSFKVSFEYGYNWRDLKELEV